jgi:hypothetical protein
MKERTYETLEAMDTYGGGFVRSLAECYRRADLFNKSRLEVAFKEYFDRYEKMAENIKRRQKHG